MAEEEDPERDALQERAAEVTIDSACAIPTNSHVSKTASTTLFAPPMPELEFTVIRNLSRGTRHWCVKGKHIICQERLCPSYDRGKYEIATSHDDPFCLDCLRAAEQDYEIVSPERFAHGEAQSGDAATKPKGADKTGRNVKSDRRIVLNKLVSGKKADRATNK